MAMVLLINFHSAETRLVAGRDYTWTDVYGLRPVAIVSENLARESWGSAAGAIGKRFRITTTQAWQEVIEIGRASCRERVLRSG